jgi:tRNA modification GTPase
MRREFDMDDTIAAVSTPVGEGGIGIVRLSGKKALSIADRIFTPKSGRKPSGCKAYTTHYGHVISRRETGGVIDEVILTVMRAPRSYTKEDVVEINCHGGIIALRKVLELTLSRGARLARPGEYTKRAFLNGRIDLAQAEAVLDIIRSKTESSMRVSLGHLEGKLSGKIKGLKEGLLDILSEVEVGIDFSREDIELASTEEISGRLKGILGEIKKLIDEAWKGIILKEGILCVICGKPNVGKSSLMNILLRRNRVIVTPIPGTTRDAIEEEINLKGVPVRVVDTAGISRARDVVEKHGIRKSRLYIKMADLIIFMLDCGRQWSKADKDIFNAIKGRNFIIIANKSDLARKLDTAKMKKITGRNEIIELSLLKKKNVEKLEEAILKKIWHGEVLHPEGTFVSSLRHRKNLEECEKQIVKTIKALSKNAPPSPEIMASDLREAVFFLGSILGDTAEPDILQKVFSKFCIGK